jgi:hypothetical protein
MYAITAVKFTCQRIVCIRSWPALLQFFSLVYPPASFFLRKIPGMVLFRPAIAAAGVAGLFDLHFDQFGEAGL